MEQIFRNSRYKSILAIFCAFGWSLAYPLIKIGYQEFQIASADLGGKILFAGIRFFFAGWILRMEALRHVCQDMTKSGM